MARYEFMKGLPAITTAEGKQVGRADDLVVEPERKMVNHDHEHDNDASEPGGLWAGMLAGMLIGGLAAAVTMLLLAPQSGKKTRAKLQRQSRKLRKQTVKTVEGAVAQARGKARQITHDVRKQAEELEQRGHARPDGQRGNLATIVEAGKNAVQRNRD